MYIYTYIYRDLDIPVKKPSERYRCTNITNNCSKYGFFGQNKAHFLKHYTIELQKIDSNKVSRYTTKS